MNSYDNSILFTDYVLNEFIKKLKQQEDAKSFLLYTSDHGEDIFDDGCDKSGHGLETKNNFEIASFIWGGVLKSMLRLNEAIIDVKEG